MNVVCVRLTFLGGNDGPDLSCGTVWQIPPVISKLTFSIKQVETDTQLLADPLLHTVADCVLSQAWAAVMYLL